MISIDCARHRIRALLLILGGLGLSGCIGGANDFERFPVEGGVTLDGQPLETGKILFNPQQEGLSSFGEISGGKFALSGTDALSPGPYRVEIYGMKLTGKKVPSADDPATLVDETINIVPKRYNLQSTLSANLPPGGPKEPLSFDLNSEGSKSKNPGTSKSRKP